MTQTTHTGDHANLRPYSEDLRIRIVKALQKGMSKSGAARLFSVSLSAIKRYASTAERGLSLAPRKGGGRLPKADEVIRRLLEEDVKASNLPLAHVACDSPGP